MTALPLDNPLLEFLGIELVRAVPGECEFQLELGPQHLNRQASLHGGLTATLLDAACGYAGLASADGGVTLNAVTVMLAISYIGKADRGRLSAVGRVTASGRKIYFANAELRSEDGLLLATAQGSFKRASGTVPGA